MMAISVCHSWDQKAPEPQGGKVRELGRGCGMTIPTPSRCWTEKGSKSRFPGGGNDLDKGTEAGWGAGVDAFPQEQSREIV